MNSSGLWAGIIWERISDHGRRKAEKTIQFQGVSDPHWHSPSWPMLSETQIALEAYGIQVTRILVDATEQLKQRKAAGAPAWFWFDS